MHEEWGVACIPLVRWKTSCLYHENWLKNQISLTGDHLSTSGWQCWYVRVFCRPDNIGYRLRGPYCVHKLPPKGWHVVVTRSGVPCLHCSFWLLFFLFVVGMWAGTTHTWSSLEPSTKTVAANCSLLVVSSSSSISSQGCVARVWRRRRSSMGWEEHATCISSLYTIIDYNWHPYG